MRLPIFENIAAGVTKDWQEINTGRYLTIERVLSYSDFQNLFTFDEQQSGRGNS